jgi:hypothetical protein
MEGRIKLSFLLILVLLAIPATTLAGPAPAKLAGAYVLSLAPPPSFLM